MILKLIIFVLNHHEINNTFTYYIYITSIKLIGTYMAQLSIPVRDGLPSDITDLATEFGYKVHGNGGTTKLISDILESIILKHNHPKSNFDLTQLIEKKAKPN